MVLLILEFNVSQAVNPENSGIEVSILIPLSVVLLLIDFTDNLSAFASLNTACTELLVLFSLDTAGAELAASFSLDIVAEEFCDVSEDETGSLAEEGAGSGTTFCVEHPANILTVAAVKITIPVKLILNFVIAFIL